MLRPAHPFSKVDKEAVIRALKDAGSYDPDVLDGGKSALLARARFQKLMGLLLMIAGIPVSLLREGIPGQVPPLAIGIPLLLLGWVIWRLGARNRAAVEAGFAEYVTSPEWYP